jgi:CheY-like chemotaxis protein
MALPTNTSVPSLSSAATTKHNPDALSTSCRALAAKRRRMRELVGNDIKIIALTGYGQADDQRRAFEAGFDFHLTKPVALEKLQELLATLNGNRPAE